MEIIKTDCFWREIEAGSYLTHSPETGKTYFLTLKKSGRIFDFHAGLHLPMVYLSPSAYFDGFQNEKDIRNTRLCRGEITKIINENEQDVTILFVVTSVLSLEEILAQFAPTTPEPGLMDFFPRFANIYFTGHHFSVQKMGDYYLLTGHGQGDFGQTCIVGKSKNRMYACMVNKWSLKENIMYIGKLLPDPSFIKMVKAESQIYYRFSMREGSGIEVFLKLRRAEYYDNTPRRIRCIRNFKMISKKLSQNAEILLSTPSGHVQQLKRTDDLRTWLKNEFKGGFEEVLG